MSELALELIEKERREKTGKLDLGYCGLRDFPPELFDLTWLDELLFSNNIWDLQSREWIFCKNGGEKNRICVKKLPDAFKNLRNLKKLSLGDGLIGWMLENFEELSTLSSLRFLNLRGTDVNDASFLSSFSCLESLDLCGNNLTDVSFLSTLSTLQSLDLSVNNLTDVSFLSTLTTLQFLDLSRNNISNVSFLNTLSSLQSLYLIENNLTDVSFLSALSGLQSLNLSLNNISDVISFSTLSNLQSLDLSGNKISDVSFLRTLSNLQYLDLGGNKISDVSFLSTLSNLQSLDLRNNKISDVISLSTLSGLQSLDLSDNKISDYNFLSSLSSLQSLFLCDNNISDVCFLSSLSSLQSLDLRNNKITDVSYLNTLSSLQSLFLNNNEITDIAPFFSLIQKGLITSSTNYLGDIHLAGNPIVNPPMSIVKKGDEAILDWFEQTAEGVEPLYEAKVLILGQGGAGKTTLTNLLLDPDYEVKPFKEESTLGIEIHKGREFNHRKTEKKIKAHLWDFGGQDIQKMLHQFFITENSLYIIVSDKRTESTNYDYWFQIIDLLGPKSSVIVLENPKDMKSSNRDFPLSIYKDRFPNLTITSYEVNLQEIKNAGLSKWNCFIEDIEEKLSSLEIVNRPVPKKWPRVRDKLEKLTDKKYITKDEFYKICSTVDLSNKDHADLCLFYLKELGDLVYYDEPGLYNNIFLNHNWLTQGMYYILSDPSVKERCGEFTREQAFTQWEEKGYSEDAKEKLLNLLLKDRFDICYELDNTDHFITPILLPNDKPELWGLETNLHFRYQYGFIPHGMFSRLIVRLHEKIDGEKRWETGVVLKEHHEKRDTTAEVQQSVSKETGQTVIDIKINGNKEGCKDLLAFVRRAVESLHKEFLNISFKEYVACNCKNCRERIQEKKEPSFYPFKRLWKKILNGKYFEECPNSNFSDINIGEILSDIIIENSAKENLDNAYLYRLKEMGLSITNINNNNTNNNNSSVNQSDFGKADSDASADSKAEAKSEAVNNVSIEIQNILNILEETEMLKEDIEDERKLLEKSIDKDEVDVTISDIEKAEKAVKEIEKATKEESEVSSKSKKRLQRFIKDLSNEESSIHKVLKGLRKGRDYGVGLAEMYNKVAENVGMPSVPPLALGIIKKL